MARVSSSGEMSLNLLCRLQCKGKFNLLWKKFAKMFMILESTKPIFKCVQAMSNSIKLIPYTLQSARKKDIERGKRGDHFSVH